MNGYDCIDGNCQCRYCHATKPCTDFTPSQAARGHTLRCRNCTRQALRAGYAATHPDCIHRPPRIDTNCAWCGTTFRRTRDRATYCSNTCRGAANRKPETCTVYYLTCKRCAGLFTSATSIRKYCGPGHCAVFRHSVDTCRACGKPRQRWHTYCEDCRQTNAAATVKRQKPKRRATRRNVLTETVDIQAVYRRDGWQCGICRTPVDPTLTYPHPLSASLDHVIPIAMNGSHTYLNTQLAHLRCNMDKRDAPPVVRGKVRRDQVLF